MTWFKVDDGFYSHAKSITAGTAALGLWVRCGSWSARHLTDGFIPVNVAREFGTASNVKALVSSGLWSETDGGYRFNDFGEYNPTSEAVRADREAAKERQRKAREVAKARRDAANTTSEVTPMSRRDTPVTLEEVQSPRPDPTRPEGSKEPLVKRGKRATPPPDRMPITAEMTVWANENAPDVRLVVETARMLDWARGKGETKVDWLATWRNWMSRAQGDIEKDRARRPAVKAGNGVYADADEAWL